MHWPPHENDDIDARHSTRHSGMSKGRDGEMSNSFKPVPRRKGSLDSFSVRKKKNRYALNISQSVSSMT